MATGAELAREKEALIGEHYLALKLQMKKLAPHFPTSEELIALNDVVGDLSRELGEDEYQVLIDRDFMYDLRFSFQEIEYHGEKQVTWIPWPLVDLPEFFVTANGELLRGYFVKEHEEKLPYVKRGWNFHELKDSVQILEIWGLILSDNKEIEDRISFWENTRGLVRKYTEELFPNDKYFAT